MKTDVTERFTNQIMLTQNDPGLLFYMLPGNKFQSIAFKIGNKIIAEGTHDGSNLGEDFPAFTAALTVEEYDIKE